MHYISRWVVTVLLPGRNVYDRRLKIRRHFYETAGKRIKFIFVIKK